MGPFVDFLWSVGRHFCVSLSWLILLRGKSAIKFVHEDGIFFLIERSRQFIRQTDEGLLEVTEEGGDVVDGARPCVVGAAAGVGAAVAQSADAAFRGSIASCGDVVVLFGAVNAAADITKGDSRLISHAYHAGAGEEFSVH